VLDEQNALLRQLESVDVHSLTAARLGDEIRMIRSTIDLLELQAARRVAVFDERGAFYELGEHSTVDWMRRNTHVSTASADNQVTLARQLDALQPTVSAVEEGAISYEHAVRVAREMKDLPQSAQVELLEAAVDRDPKELRKVGNEIRYRDNQEAFSRQAFEHHRLRSLRFFEHANGMIGFQGALPAPEGMKFRLGIESLVGIPPKGDERTQDQPNADGLNELCSLAVGSGKLPRMGGRAPQLTVIIQTQAGREVAARLEGYGPVSLGTADRLRGQDRVERTQSVDAKGVTLNFGRARRCGTENQRLEVGTRYQHCIGPGCDVPIRDCEIHHVKSWAEGGGTDVVNAVPLCRRKRHPMVTEGAFKLVPTADFKWSLVAPPGAEVGRRSWRSRGLD